MWETPHEWRRCAPIYETRERCRKSRESGKPERDAAGENFWRNLVPRLFLLAIAGLFLALGAPSADAMSVNNKAAYVMVDASAPKAEPTLIEGRSAFTQDSDAEIAGAVHRVIALGFAALILALGAVGVKALWIMDRKAFTPYDALSQAPYGLLDQPARTPCESAKTR
jgi:hypothetical protein